MGKGEGGIGFSGDAEFTGSGGEQGSVDIEKDGADAGEGDKPGGVGGGNGRNVAAVAMKDVEEGGFEVGHRFRSEGGEVFRDRGIVDGGVRRTGGELAGWWWGG